MQQGIQADHGKVEVITHVLTPTSKGRTQKLFGNLF